MTCYHKFLTGVCGNTSSSPQGGIPTISSKPLKAWMPIFYVDGWVKSMHVGLILDHCLVSGTVRRGRDNLKEERTWNFSWFLLLMGFVLFLLDRIGIL